MPELLKNLEETFVYPIRQAKESRERIPTVGKEKANITLLLIILNQKYFYMNREKMIFLWFENGKNIFYIKIGDIVCLFALLKIKKDVSEKHSHNLRTALIN